MTTEKDLKIFSGICAVIGLFGLGISIISNSEYPLYPATLILMLGVITSSITIKDDIEED